MLSLDKQAIFYILYLKLSLFLKSIEKFFTKFQLLNFLIGVITFILAITLPYHLEKIFINNLKT